MILVVLVLIWSRFVEPNTVVTKNYDFRDDSDKIRVLKVAVFSDVHIGVFNKKSLLNKIVSKINKSEADIVLMPGDFVYSADDKNLKEIFSVLNKIEKPKIAVLGNHDYEKTGLSRKVSSALKSSGILLVDNKNKIININSTRVEIIGLADLITGGPDYSVLEKDDTDHLSDLKIILSHNPDIIYNIKNEVQDLKDVDILIAGHTHAGQIRVPFIYKRIIPTKHDLDKGFYNIDNIDMFITPGIGNVLLPMRLFNFPEISIINLYY